MKIHPGYLRVRSGASTRTLSANPRTTLVAAALEELKARLLEDQLEGIHEAALREQLRRAAAESTSLAWTTPFPLLALPELLAEKGREARCRYERQQAILNPARAAFSLSA